MENALLILISIGILFLIFIQLILWKNSNGIKERSPDIFQRNSEQLKENLLLENIKIVDLREFNFDEDKLIENNSIHGLIEGMIRTAPSLSTAIIAGKATLYQVHFAPELLEGLSSGNYYLMDAKIGGQHLNVMDISGKIRGQGSISETGLLSGVATMTVVWQIMAVVTQRKYLHDINKRLAEIERGISTIINFLEDQEIGKQMGKLKYIQGVVELLKDSSNIYKMETIKNQIELIYRESLEGASFNLIRARRMVGETKNKKFDDSQKKSKEFEDDYYNYLKKIDSVIVYYYLISLCEYLSFSMEMEPNLGDSRFLEIQRNHESLKRTVSEDLLVFKNKSSEISASHWRETFMTFIGPGGALEATFGKGFGETVSSKIGGIIKDEKRKEETKRLSEWMEDLQKKCEESNQIISEVINSRTRVKNWLIETKSKGMDLVFETDTEGKIKRVASAPTVIK